MANYESVVRRPGSVAQADIDAGLRAYMNKVYGLMGLAMVITGALAYVFGNDLYAVLDALRESQRTDAYVEPQTAFIPASLLNNAVFLAPQMGCDVRPARVRLLFRRNHSQAKRIDGKSDVLRLRSVHGHLDFDDLRSLHKHVYCNSFLHGGDHVPQPFADRLHDKA